MLRREERGSVVRGRRKRVKKERKRWLENKSIIRKNKLIIISRAARRAEVI